MKHVVHTSGGGRSAAAALRVVDRYGPENTVFLFADVLAEDPDLYRFLDDLATLTGVPITTVCEGRTPMQVFLAEGYIGNSRVAPCSRILKQEVLDRWCQVNTTPDDTTLYMGMDWTEGDRLKRIQKRLAPYPVVSPLAEWKPYMDKVASHQFLIDRGLRLPLLYEWAQNNNCAGLCVRGGQAHWAAALRNIPERYAQMEAVEEQIRARRGDVSILKDRRNGANKPLPLRVLRQGIERNTLQPDLLDWGACGCDPMLVGAP